MVTGAIVHDVRNALTVISGNAQIMVLKGERMGKGELVQRAEKTVGQIERIQEIIERVGSLSRRAEGAVADIPPDTAIDNAIYALQSRIEREGVTIERYRAEGDRILACDASLLEYALIELTSRCLPPDMTGGKLTVRSESGERFWKLEFLRHNGRAPSSPGEDWCDPNRSYTLLSAVMAVEDLGGELAALSDEGSFGWRLTVPWR